jgi:hypothetical protein
MSLNYYLVSQAEHREKLHRDKGCGEKIGEGEGSHGFSHGFSHEFSHGFSHE